MLWKVALASALLVGCTKREDIDRTRSTEGFGGGDLTEAGSSGGRDEGAGSIDTDPTRDTDPVSNRHIDTDALPEDRPPVTSSIQTTVPEDTPIPLQLPGVDPEGSTLTWILLTQPDRGTLTGTPPQLVYQPSPDQVGEDGFTFAVSDGHHTAFGAVALRIMPVQDPPTAVPSDHRLLEDASVALPLEATDVDGDALTWGLDEPPAHGTLTGTPPNWVYTPDPDFAGEDGFLFWVSDGLERSAPTAVGLTVEPVNDPPWAQAASLSVLEGDEASVRLVVGDVDGDALDMWVSSAPSLGVASIVDGALIYRSNGGLGDDRLTWTLSDGVIQVQHLATITVSPQPPTTPSRTFRTLGNVDLSVSAGEGLLRDASHPFGVAVSVTGETVATELGGTVELRTDGSFDYLPPRGTGGLSDTFVASLTSEDGGLARVPVTLELGSVLWFVDNTAAGDGTRWAPFGSLTEAADVSGEEDVLVVGRGDGSSSGMDEGVTLQRGQELLGTAAAVVVDGIDIWPALGPPRLSARGIVLAPATRVQGVELTQVTGAGIQGEGATGASVVDVRMEEVGAGAIVLTDSSTVALRGLELSQVSGAVLTATSSSDLHLSDVIASDIAGHLVDLQRFSGSLDMHGVVGTDVAEGLQIDARLGQPLPLQVRVSDVDLTATGDAGTAGIDVFVDMSGAVDLSFEGVAMSGFDSLGRVSMLGSTGRTGELPTLSWLDSTLSGIGTGMLVELRDDASADIVSERSTYSIEGSDAAFTFRTFDNTHGSARLASAGLVSGGSGIKGRAYNESTLILQVDGGQATVGETGVDLRVEDEALLHGALDGGVVDGPAILEVASDPVGTDNRMYLSVTTMDGTGRYVARASEAGATGGQMFIEAPAGTAIEEVFATMGNRTDGGPPVVEQTGTCVRVDPGTALRPATP